jgi:hypothetical protein
VKGHRDFEMLGNPLPNTECHITEVVNLHHDRGDTLQSHMSLPCYKGPESLIVTFLFDICGEIRIEIESGRMCL